MNARSKTIRIMFLNAGYKINAMKLKEKEEKFLPDSQA